MKFFPSALLFAALSLVGVSAKNVHPREFYEQKFIDWMKEHNMEFKSGVEFVERLAIFSNNHDYIEEINAQNLPYTLGHNQFSHMTRDEFARYNKLGVYSNYSPYATEKSGVEGPTPTFRRQHPRRNVKGDDVIVDWTTKGAVTPVKNQGQCGSCWSFSTTGSMEGAYFLKNGKLVSFSEEMLVECDTVDSGCMGGLMDNAFGWIQKNGGLMSEDDYPYTSSTGMAGKCKADASKIVDGSAPTKFTDLKQSDDAMTAALDQQPVSIAIEADQQSFQFYSGGVLTAKCGTNLDHGVLAVGYGTLDGTDYYKVKNSWGESWGDQGYILLERNSKQRGGQCGMLMAASYPSF